MAYGLFALSILCFLAVSQGSKEQQLTGRLLKTLRDQVDYQTRPENVTLKMQLMLLSINELNVAEGYIDVDGWLSMNWDDKRLEVFFDDRSDPHDVKSVVVPPEAKLWKPDIQLYNDHASRTKLTKTDAVVLRAGIVYWVPPIHVVARCEMSIADFPNDEHRCMLKFGSWVHNANQIRLILKDNGFDVSLFTENPMWSLKSMSADVTSSTYDCCPERYETVEFWLTISREGGELRSGFVAPAVLIALLVPFQFLVHPDAKERLTFCIALLMSAAIFLFGLERSIGSNFNTMPNIMTHYMVTVGVIVVSMVKSVFHLLLYNRGGRHGKLPNILRKIFLSGLNTFCCVTRYESPVVDGASSKREKMDSVSSTHLEAQVDDVIDMLKRKEAKDAADSNAEDWRQFVMVIDRIAFVVFSIIFIIYTSYLLG